MEHITVTPDHVRRLRDSGPGHALFSDGDTVIIARESTDTAGWMMIGRHEALDDLTDAAHERGETAVTDETLAKDLTYIAGDYRAEAEHGAIACDKIASITRCLIDHGITRAAPAGGCWSDRFGARYEMTQHYAADAAPTARIQITTGNDHSAPYRVEINIDPENATADVTADVTADASADDAADTQTTAADFTYDTPPTVIAAYVRAVITPQPPTTT